MARKRCSDKQDTVPKTETLLLDIRRSWTLNRLVYEKSKKLASESANCKEIDISSAEQGEDFKVSICRKKCVDKLDTAFVDGDLTCG